MCCVVRGADGVDTVCPLEPAGLQNLPGGRRAGAEGGCASRRLDPPGSADGRPSPSLCCTGRTRTSLCTAAELRGRLLPGAPAPEAEARPGPGLRSEQRGPHRLETLGCTFWAQPRVPGWELTRPPADPPSVPPTRPRTKRGARAGLTSPGDVAGTGSRHSALGRLLVVPAGARGFLARRFRAQGTQAHSCWLPSSDAGPITRAAPVLGSS